jgi:hypothetical protein
MSCKEHTQYVFAIHQATWKGLHRSFGFLAAAAWFGVYLRPELALPFALDKFLTLLGKTYLLQSWIEQCR